jgi:hypothetical protein
MTYTFKLSRRLAMARYWSMLAMLLLSVACADDLPLDPTAAGSAPVDQAADIVVVPHSVYAETNQPIQFQARARDALLRRTSDGSEPLEIQWTTDGGTITDDGLFVAKAPGRYKVVGKGRGKKSDTTDVTVGDSVPGVVALVIAPDTAQLHPAESRQFVALGKRSDGSTAQVGAIWSATGGTIDAGGTFVADATPGRYRVVATTTSGTVSDTAMVDIAADAPPPVVPTPVAIELSPASVSLAAQTTKEFTVRALMSDNSTSDVVVRFTATGGTISATGLYTAGAAPGTYRVIAADSSGLADTATVTVTGTYTGRVIEPGMSIQAAVDANPAGTTFLLKAGVHRLQQVNPKSGNVFNGEPGTIISGARHLSGFARSGGYWVIGGQTQQGRATEASRCLSGYLSCQWPEDLFLDDQLLFRVTGLGEVGPGKWYFDYAADKIYLGDDPSGRKVETGVSAYAFGGSASSVTLRNLTIEKYAAPAQAAAVQGDNTTGWLIEDVRVRQSHGTGLRMGDRWVVRRTRVDHNGQLGIAGGGVGSLVEDSEWDHNKTLGFQVGFAGGASKFFKTDGLILRRNYIHHNDGNGIWLDIDNIRYLVQDNRVEDNYGQGIFVEISYTGKILGNQVRRNGHQRGGTWLYGAGILIAHSPDVEVAGNLVEDNYNGIAGIQQNRGTGQYGPRILQNLWVHDNVVRMSRGKTGVGDGTGTGAFSRNNRFDRNTYTLTGTAKYFAWVGGAASDTEWRNAGQDVAGSFKR